MVIPLYGRHERTKRDTDLLQEAGKNARLMQMQYEKHYDQPVRFAPILRAGYYVFLDRPPLFY